MATVAVVMVVVGVAAAFPSDPYGAPQTYKEVRTHTHAHAHTHTRTHTHTHLTHANLI